MRTAIALGYCMLCSAALAQQSPDPALNACQQLLGNANAQTIQVAVQAQTLAKQLDEAKAELAKLKSVPVPSAEPSK